MLSWNFPFPGKALYLHDPSTQRSVWIFNSMTNSLNLTKNLTMAELCSVLGLCVPCSDLVKVLLSIPRIFRHSAALIFKSNRRFLISSPICRGLAGYWLAFHK